MPESVRWAAVDAATLITRSVRHSLRSVDALVTAVILPVVILLLFVYVFGGAIRTGTRYLDYVVPGLILLCAGFGSASTAVGVCQDMTVGVVDRLRSLPIVAPAMLLGHVVASVLRNVVSTGLVLGVALALGFRPAADAGDWLAVLALLVLFMTAVSWLAACVGLLAGSVETAGAFSFVVMFLPYVSSAFVPPATMPQALHAFAAHQPVTPMVEALRALLAGAPAGPDDALAVLWWGGLAVAGAAGAALLFRRRTAR
jgi:ABC-2 type transport system permease protein